MLNVGELSL